MVTGNGYWKPGLYSRLNARKEKKFTMEYFYCPDLSEDSDLISLPAEEAHHLRNVFRKSPGEMIVLTNGLGLTAAAEIEAVGKKGVACKVMEVIEQAPSLSRRISVALALIRPNRMDWAVEKLTELGVGSIHPVSTHFTSVNVFKEKHLRKIMISALKQSKQAFLPELKPLMSFNDWITENNSYPDRIKLVAHMATDAADISRLSLSLGKKIAIAVGPEGGFSVEEIAGCEQSGFRKVKLDSHILRAETAAISAVVHLKRYL